MVDFTHFGGIYLTSSGGGAIAAGTITDGDNDDTFDTGDLDTFGFQYIGTTQLTVLGPGGLPGGQVTVPVFSLNGANPGTEYRIYYPTSDTYAFPLTLPLVTPGDFAFCFAAGTRITTPAGTEAVEALNPGDLVRTASGKDVPVKWIGRQTLFPRFAKADQTFVRVASGALGPAMPDTDLTLTADDGLILDGLVVNAGALVNGTTIAYLPAAELNASETVYHVETEDHDVILANGAPAETFIDYAGRAAYDNHDEYLALYGAERIITEMALPRISSSRMVPEEIRNRLRCLSPTTDQARVA